MGYKSCPLAGVNSGGVTYVPILTYASSGIRDAHCIPSMWTLAQLVRVPGCDPGGRSVRVRHVQPFIVVKLMQRSLPLECCLTVALVADRLVLWLAAPDI